MNEFVKSFRQFIYRDVFYLVGGSTVMVSYVYSFLNVDEIIVYLMTNPWLVVYFLVISFPVGYLVQFISNGLHLTTSDIPNDPGLLLKWLYKQFRYTKYTINGKTARSHETKVYERLSLESRNLGRLERLVALKQMGTTLGPCFITAGLFILMKDFSSCLWLENRHILVPLLIGGILLTISGWLKVMDQADLIEELYTILPLKRK